jgi:hypothetical protein
MFAMKRIILAAAFLVAISGFAAAQSTSAKSSSKTVKTTAVKKSSTVRGTSKHTVLKQETSANAKSDSTIKLQLPLPVIADSTAMPVVKNEDF